MTVDIGQLYDRIAVHYDQDAFGLLSAGRNAALRQLRTSVEPRAGLEIADLGAGTGEALAALAPIYPAARLHGIDLSAEMLALAKAKVDFHAIVSDAGKLAEHFSASSLDVVLMHFITTFIDVPATARACRDVLRPGGYLSLVSSTQEAFPAVLAGIGLKLAPIEELLASNPAVTNAETVVKILRDAGLEVVSVDDVRVPVTFASFADGLEFGEKSGFFTHVIEAFGMDRILELGNDVGISALFPLTDEYRSVAILARRPLAE